MMIQIEREQTLKQIRNRATKVVLAVQDTTSFNFAHHVASRGLGVIDAHGTSGFFAHTTLAVSDDGVPLGVFDQQVWRREPNKYPAPNTHQALPITEKESMKWLNGLYETQDSPKQVITITDREGDIYELLQASHEVGDCIVRAVRNRRLAGGGKLSQSLEECEPMATYELEVTRQRNQEKRVALVTLRSTSVRLLPPKNRKKSIAVIPMSALRMQVVEVIELDAPADVDALHWRLLTTLPVNTLEDAQRIVRFYTYRWLVERFHYVLKSGCRFEDSQLQSYEALTRFLALCSHQAWQLLQLTYQARVTPDAACDTLLTPQQWQALQAHKIGQAIPNTSCPTLAEATLWIAHLGGFIGRNSDAQPGVKVLWRGWQRLQDLVAMWEVFHPPPKDVGNV